MTRPSLGHPLFQVNSERGSQKPRTGNRHRSAKYPSDQSFLLAARDEAVAVPAVVQPIEAQHPAVAAPAQVGHAEIAARIAQNRAGEDDVLLAAELLGNLVLLLEETLGVTQTQVTLEFDRTLAHLVAAGVALVALKERLEIHLGHIQIRLGRDVLYHAVDDRDFPPLGNEVAGVDEARGLLDQQLGEQRLETRCEPSVRQKTLGVLFVGGQGNERVHRDLPDLDFLTGCELCVHHPPPAPMWFTFA